MACEIPRCPGRVRRRRPIRADALTDYGESADRVIIGGRGHGRVTGAVLGSVARSVIRRMPCPVTVVPAGQAS
ncbi:universal stress protein [Phytoactinopolyspora alkaliphila]|uniref:Universal stress protein n=1 Tax=Phytoactinopolyspora alkaliphila TaxID=1783498 RepID=A0A6N9YUA4_9ACTN|nr:universal stress protein [Phytoactinopolyspora alkaliphila]